MKKLANKKFTFFAVSLIAFFLTYVAFYGLNVGKINLQSAAEMRFGIDIKGGIEAYFRPDDPDYSPTDKELEDARRVFEIRLDSKNVMDRDILVDKANGAIMVRFPFRSNEDASNAQSTINDIGKTAKLEFKDPEGNMLELWD